MSGYLRAWDSNDPADIGALFADDATLRFAPFEDPHRGRADIVAAWLAHRDEPGEWEFDWHPLAIDGDTAMIEAVTRYRDGRVYSNLWVFRLDADTVCHDFVEWYMPHPLGGEK